MADDNTNIIESDSADKKESGDNGKTGESNNSQNNPLRAVVKKHNRLLTFAVILYICTLLPIIAAAAYIFYAPNPNLLIAIGTACGGILFIVAAVFVRKHDLYFYKKNIVTAILEEKLTMRKYIFDNSRTTSYLKDICDKSIYPNPPAVGVSDCFKANYRGVEFSFYDFDIHSDGNIASLNWMGQLLVMTLNKPTDSLIILSSKKDGSDFESMFTLTTGTRPITDSDKVEVDNPYTATDLTDSEAVKSALVKLKYSAQSKVSIIFSYTRLYLFMENIFDPFEPNLANHSLDQVAETLRHERELLLSAIDPLIEADIVK